MAATRKSTLVLVAERAGVSIASVSRVLNGLPASAEVTTRVQDAARELGYVPHAAARSLKVGRTEQIELAVADVGNPVYVSMMNAVTTVIGEAGYRLVVSSAGSDPHDQIELLRSLNRGYADGLILSPLRVTDPLLDQIAASRIPVVVIGTVPERAAIDSVRANSRKGVALAVRHLHERGRRRIAFVNGPVDTVPGAARLSGYLGAIEEIGGALSGEMQVEATDFTYAAGLVAVATLLEQASPDAIVCANDLLAVAALKVINSRGLRVPEDIALVGMDDSDVAQLTSPSITSVDLRSAKRARKAAKLLLSRLEQPDLPPRIVVIEPRLTIRESSGRAG